MSPTSPAAIVDEALASAEVEELARIEIEELARVEIEELARIDAPDPTTFARDYVRAGRPVVVTGLTDGWLPASEWTCARVAERYGDASVIAAVLRGGTLARDSVDFHRISLRELIASFARPGSASHYVMAPIWNLPEQFQRDHHVPPYCANAWHLRAKFWVGKRHTVTPMHRDVPHNLHVHLTGRKRWLLYPPGGAGMYPRGLFSGMPNFSAVDPERPDYDRYPRFRGKRAVGGVIGEGETLFIPHGWWHHTRSLDDAVAVNFWWGGPLVAFAAFASATFKRLRRIRHGEWG